MGKPPNHHYCYLLTPRLHYEHAPHCQVHDKKENRSQEDVEEENIAFPNALPSERTVMVIVSNAEVAVRTVEGVFLSQCPTAGTALEGGSDLRV